MIPGHEHPNCDCIDIDAGTGQVKGQDLYAAQISVGYFKTRAEAETWKKKLIDFVQKEHGGIKTKDDELDIPAFLRKQAPAT